MIEYRKTKLGHFAYQVKDMFNFFSILNPFYLARRNLKKAITSVKLKGNILDIGAGSQPYKQYFESYTSLEILRSVHDADYYYKDVFPFNDNQFDNALCTQVLEHVFEPKQFIKEIKRVVKGKVIITVPFVWDEHEQPYDYARYSSYGLRHLLKDFTIIEHRKLSNDLSLMFQLINMIIYKWHKRTAYVLALPINVMGLAFSFIKIKDFYLDNFFVIEAIKE